ncbi:MAG: hypothetical protein ACPL09_02745 [Candidatus Methanodesulfokora sp.]
MRFKALLIALLLVQIVFTSAGGFIIRVLNEHGLPVPFALVMVADEMGNIRRITTANSSGFALINETQGIIYVAGPGFIYERTRISNGTVVLKEGYGKIDLKYRFYINGTQLNNSWLPVGRDIFLEVSADYSGSYLIAANSSLSVRYHQVGIGAERSSAQLNDVFILRSEREAEGVVQVLVFTKSGMYADVKIPVRFSRPLSVEQEGSTIKVRSAYPVKCLLTYPGVEEMLEIRGSTSFSLPPGVNASLVCGKERFNMSTPDLIVPQELFLKSGTNLSIKIVGKCELRWNISNISGFSYNGIIKLLDSDVKKLGQGYRGFLELSCDGVKKRIPVRTPVIGLKLLNLTNRSALLEINSSDQCTLLWGVGSLNRSEVVESGLKELRFNGTSGLFMAKLLCGVFSAEVNGTIPWKISAEEKPKDYMMLLTAGIIIAASLLAFLLIRRARSHEEYLKELERAYKSGKMSKAEYLVRRELYERRKRRK